MPRSFGNANKFLAAAGILAFMVMMLANPDYFLNSARRGLYLYATAVLPSLFPFYFCSLTLTYLGAAKTISSLFKKPVRLLYNAPKESAYVLMLSMLSGYPVGASMTAELFDAGVIDEKEAKTVAAFASTSGPIFMLGTVGSAIFEDMRVGVTVLAAHYLAALLNGLIFRLRKPAERTEQRVSLMSREDQDSLMSKSISKSTLSMLYVGGYIVLGGMLVDAVALFKADALLVSALGEDVAAPIVALIFGAIEMTRGCMASAACKYLPLATALCAGIVSLGGLSVTLQNYTFLSRCKMTLPQIAIRKLSHGVLAFGLAFAIASVLQAAGA